MRKGNRDIFALGLIAVASISFSCQTNVESREIARAPVTNITPTPATLRNVVPTPQPKSYSSIRSIDFANFTFPWTKDQGAPDLFTLEGGKKESVSDESGAYLQTIEYGDVTSDGQEEALISISPETGGNCQCFMVYIYALKNGNPELLWSFDTWDDAEGGFKRAYAENGDLVVELFGDDKFENDEWHFDTPAGEGKFQGLCCPTAFTRIRFHWNGSKFVPAGKPEMFDYDWRKRANGK